MTTRDVDKEQVHTCRLSEEHLSSFDCFSDDQMLPILLHMDPDTLLNVGRTSKRLHRLVCDRDVWVRLLRGIDNFSKERVEELARFGTNGSPEMKAEVVKAAASRMKPSDDRYRVNAKVSVKGWGESPDTFEVDGVSIGEAVQNLTMEGRSEKLTLARVASIVGASFNIEEVHCNKSISNAEMTLRRCAKHVEKQDAKMEYLELVGLPRKSPPYGFKKGLFFDLLKLSKKWKIMYLDWFPHGRYLAGLSGDVNISTGVREWAETISGGNIRSLFMDKGLESVNLKDLKKLWRISGQVNIPHNEERIQVDGGKGDDPDGGWQQLVALHAGVNGNNFQ